MIVCFTQLDFEWDLLILHRCFVVDSNCQKKRKSPPECNYFSKQGLPTTDEYKPNGARKKKEKEG